jgi:prepilin-type N-terminal cleavage/methylation domain-containing protein
LKSSKFQVSSFKFFRGSKFQVSSFKLRNLELGTWNLKLTSGFTLLEIMIAMAILSISLLAIYHSVGISLRASGMAEKVDIANQLGRQKMAEIMMSLDEDIARGAFPDEKEEQGTFDKPYERYKWAYQIRKVEIPLTNLPGQEGGAPGGENAGGGGTPSPSGTQTTPGIEGQAANLAKVVSKKISDSIRELKLTVSWGEGEEDEDKIVLTTHLAKLR